MENKNEIVEKILWDRQQSNFGAINKEEKEINRQIKNNKYMEKLDKELDKIYSNKYKEKIKSYIDLIIEEVIEMDTATIKKAYRQGFKDGLNIAVDSLK